MSVDVFPRAWSVIPPISAGANTGHPLCPRFGFVCNGAIVDLVRGVRGVSVGSTPGKFSTGSVRGYSGSVREHTATTDLDYLGPTKLIWPTQEVTVLLGYEKTDGVNRISAAFGQDAAGGTGSGGTRVSSHLPFQDGIVYWDFGGDQDNVTRLPVGGLSFGNDIWAFTTGPRGMELWQNGVLRGSNAANPTRNVSDDNVTFGKLNGTTSDLALYKFFFVYWRQLKPSEISELTIRPFSWVVT